MPIDVVKLGGSLLQRPDLGRLLGDWMIAQGPGRQLLFVVGGGQTIDALRQLDSLHRLDPVQLHWRCIRALRFTAEVVYELLQRQLPDTQWIESDQQWNAWLQTPHSPAIVLPELFYSADCNDVLPRDWSTTSDSIAALLARQLVADRLVLLKSCAIPAAASLQQLADLAMVDPVFPQIAAGLSVTMEQLGR